MLRPKSSPILGVAASLGGLSAMAIGLFLVQVAATHSWADWYLVWNLGLALVPLLLAGALWTLLQPDRRPAVPWASWQGISLSVLWLVFFPNSFYMMTDYIHLGDPWHRNLLYSAAMFSLFVLAGLLSGCISLYLVHSQLRRHLSRWAAAGWVAAILLLCSFAMYLGRDLRWNTWDLLLNPAGILFDVSDQVITPSAHPQAFTTTATFFVFTAAVYGVAYGLARTLQRQRG